jgi:hypothetical protein
MSSELHAQGKSLPPPPLTHWIGGWAGHRIGLGDVYRRKILHLLGLELRPLGRPACSPSLYRMRYLGSTIARPINVEDFSWKSTKMQPVWKGVFFENKIELTGFYWFNDPLWFTAKAHKHCTKPGVTERLHPSVLCRYAACFKWQRAANCCGGHKQIARDVPTFVSISTHEHPNPRRMLIINFNTQQNKFY